MPPQSSAPWDLTTPTLPTHLHKSHDGSSTSLIETQGDHRPDKDTEGRHPMHRGPRQEGVEAGVEAGVEVEEEGKGHSPYPDMHLLNLPKSS